MPIGDRIAIEDALEWGGVRVNLAARQDVVAAIDKVGFVIVLRR